MKKIVVFNHGKDSHPWNPKISALAKIARSRGYSVESLDYTNQPDPEERVKQLLSFDLKEFSRIVLTGSSMGAYVATVASETILPAGLFLMAPAFYLPGYRQTEFSPPDDGTIVVHGWRDEIVPPENSWRFCKSHHVPLHMLDADHRMNDVIPELGTCFDSFLKRL
ncbi:MAG: YqiA/YcfP family alpha/beta fold hydrolase [Gammaproteobacteria bacterium]